MNRAGGTVLIAAIDPSAVRLSWRFLPVILASTAIMFGWAMLINNIGRRKYPQYWWAPGKTFVIDQPVEKKDDEEAAVGTARDEGEDARKREISHPVRGDHQDKAPTAS
jgi:CBS-domain-containing membrane protein